MVSRVKPGQLRVRQPAPEIRLELSHPAVLERVADCREDVAREGLAGRAVVPLHSALVLPPRDDREDVVEVWECRRRAADEQRDATVQLRVDGAIEPERLAGEAAGCRRR